MTCNEDVWKTIVALSDQVAMRLRKYKLVCNTVQIHVRDTELHTYERQQHLLAPTDAADEISRVALDLFQRSYDWTKSVRSFGVRAAQVNPAEARRQISLFDTSYQTDEKKAVDTVVDALRTRFGKDIVRKGVQLAGGDELLPHGQMGWNAGGFASLKTGGREE